VDRDRRAVRRHGYRGRGRLARQRHRRALGRAGGGPPPRAAAPCVRVTWLRAGEALSAVLLTAVELDLAVSPMSDVAEVGGTRELLCGMLSGIGYPYLVLRIGVAEPTSGVPATPRRDPAEVIEMDI
jgi:hypothetical protein